MADTQPRRLSKRRSAFDILRAALSPSSPSFSRSNPAPPLSHEDNNGILRSMRSRPSSSRLSIPYNNITKDIRSRHSAMDAEHKSKSLASRHDNYIIHEVREQEVRCRPGRRRTSMQQHNMYMSDEEEVSSAEGETYSPIDDDADASDNDGETNEDDKNNTTDEAKAVQVVFSGRPSVVDIFTAAPIQKLRRPASQMTYSRPMFKQASRSFTSLHSASTTSLNDDKTFRSGRHHKVASLYVKPMKPSLNTSVLSLNAPYPPKINPDGDVASPVIMSGTPTPSSYLDFDPFASSPMVRHQTMSILQSSSHSGHQHKSSRSRAGSISGAALRGLSRRFSFAVKKKSHTVAA